MKIYGQYKNLVWWTMDLVGVTRSIRWKVLMAVAIQFVVSVALTLVPVFLSGLLRIWATAGLFALAIVAFVNTVLIVREDLIDPLLDLREASRRIEQGDLEVEVSATDQRDEIGDLCRSFADMREHLVTVADQAEALAEQDFEASVLDHEIPGRFGSIIRTMTENLTEYVERVERDRDRFQLLNYLVGHDVPNLLNIVYARLEMVRQDCDDPELLDNIDVIEEQVKEIEFLSNTVANLTSSKSVRRIDVKHILVREVERIRDSYPDATVTMDLPDEPVHIRCNALLARVFENLITNGIEHNDVEEPRVEIDLTDADEHIDVTISDNGPGIDADDPNMLFETVQEGTGLNIVHTIVNAFEGDIWVEDTATKGTTFRIHLPRQSGPTGNAADSDQDWLEQTKKTT